METADILIKNANELITLKGPNKPRIKKQMSNLGIIKKGSIAIKNEKIIDVGTNLKYKAKNIIDAKGKTVMPGFVDPHTHLVFAGSREFELDLKLKGLSYMDILKKGGGIIYTVDKTRKATSDQLLDESRKRLDTMIQFGTTSCEAKSGYGLNTETELKILKVNKKLAETHPIDLVSTFLGAHAIPKHSNAEEYTKILVDEMIPKVANYAMFCDVFCEKGVFTPLQSKKILLAGKKYGLIPKIHADEIIDTGGAALAADVGAISADHLLMSSDAGLKKMAQKGVIGVMLPGTPFSLMMKEYANARKIIDMDIPVALATDLNPNCYIENMQFMIQLACFNMKMTLAEALCASTFNAACAIGLNDYIGSLEKGKQADVIILDCPSNLWISYHIGVNIVKTVIKKGIMI
ncbi:MAG: imidazolonepropionase [Thermoplasmata archaeon M9B1D]|nr:MAG: imidazolonepropionase [Thermoplasmata archaeon M9B1D]PNX50607.1 MAG: imidazolonepropionase [Thermoplasmata archaeon M8B2D]